MTDETSNLLLELGLLLLLTGAVALPVVLLVIRHQRRNPRLKPSPELTETGHAFRRTALRTEVPDRTAGILYAALTVSLMGAAFVFARLGQMAWYGVWPYTTSWVHKLYLATYLLRLMLLDASVALLRRRPSAGWRARVAVGLTVVTAPAVVVGDVCREAALRTRSWLPFSLDVGGYHLGLLATAALVAVALAKQPMDRPTSPQSVGA